LWPTFSHKFRRSQKWFAIRNQHFIYGGDRLVFALIRCGKNVKARHSARFAEGPCSPEIDIGCRALIYEYSKVFSLRIVVGYTEQGPCRRGVSTPCDMAAVYTEPIFPHRKSIPFPTLGWRSVVPRIAAAISSPLKLFLWLIAGCIGLTKSQYQYSSRHLASCLHEIREGPFVPGKED